MSCNWISSFACQLRVKCSTVPFVTLLLHLAQMAR